jgi:hypothetical protein
MNEPPLLDREGLYELWEACYDSIRKVPLGSGRTAAPETEAPGVRCIFMLVF